MYKKILLPTDGSENAENAGRHALWIANVSGAEIIVLNVFELYHSKLSALPLSTVPEDNENLYEPLMKEGEKMAQDFKERLESCKCETNCQNVKLSTLVKEGRPHEVILDTLVSEDIDLVVMGASGRHGFDRITLGSVTERVVRKAKAPVMVIN